MTIKCTGYEWNAFYNEPEFWKEGTWWDACEITVNGLPISDDYYPNADGVANTDVVKITNGVVFLRECDDNGPSMESYFKRWRKKQTTSIFVVEAPTEKEEYIIALIRKSGCKVRK